MLRSLTIENFAIIESVNLDFNQGMTILSGETGAGKSIIIDALSLLVGGRGSVEYIRTGTDRLMVEGLFDISVESSEICTILEDFGLTIDLSQDDLLIRREINQQGKNLIRINGQLANVTILKEIGGFLADIHGQNEHQALLNPQRHLHLLDTFAGSNFKEKLEDYQTQYNHFRTQRKEWLRAQTNDLNQQQRLNFLQFQWDELNKAELVSGEEAILEKTSQQIQNQQEIQEQLTLMNQLLSESENSLLDLLNQTLQAMSRIVNYDDQYPAVEKKLIEYKYEIEEIAHFVANEMVNKLDSREDFDDIEERLSQLSQMKRKFQMDIEELITYRDEIEIEINQIIHRDQYLEGLEKQLLLSYQQCLSLAKELHAERQSAAQELTLAVKSELNDLYMKESLFETRFKKVDEDEELVNLSHSDEAILKLNAWGLDELEFYVATNIGESTKPLVKVASGGELSRFMLALKVIFSQGMDEKVMVFDEIDTGVSGRVAFAIAQKMYQLSKQHQVLAITHLPQVAAIADYQLYIEKKVVDERTQTQVRLLTIEQRYNMIARMMSGEQVTETSIQVVKDMIQQLKQ